MRLGEIHPSQFGHHLQEEVLRTAKSQYLYRCLVTAALAVALQCAGVVWAAEGLTLGLGLDYSTGHYGEAVATDIFFVPLFAKWERDPWTVKLNLSYVEMRAPTGVVLNGDEAIATQSGSGARSTERGMGDVVLGVTRTLWAAADGGYGLDLTGKIKFPTADESRGLGTGRADYTLLVDGYGALGGTIAFAGLGHRWTGSPPGVQYRNVWSGNAGLSRKLTPAISAGVMYDYRQSASGHSPGASELTPFASWKLGAGLKLQVYATFGLSEGSADRGLGLVLQRTF